jgi:manganese transport protein
MVKILPYATTFSMMLHSIRRLGPGLLVAAAFIGPGTIVTASRAGASYGMALVWAVVFSAFATTILQEMAARVGLVTRNGLSESIRKSLSNPVVRFLSLGLVTVAITLGNAAYQTGNLLGASLGLEILTGIAPKVWAVVIAAIAFALLASGTYRVIQRVLVALVVLMSCVFLLTAILVKPSLAELAVGLLPTIPEGSLLTVIALIGTTVVPYNLFLHASTVQQKWPETLRTEQALADSRLDTSLSVALGGLVTIAVVINATPLDDVVRLDPWARSLYGLGLCAAGLTSAITAPLAAAYATSGALGWEHDLRGRRFRTVWGFVVITGLVLALAGGSPTEAIVLAQAANGLLLPLIAVFLLFVVNDPKLMGAFRNRAATNVLGALVVLVVAGLGVYQLARVLGLV